MQWILKPQTLTSLHMHSLCQQHSWEKIQHPFSSLPAAQQLSSFTIIMFWKQNLLLWHLTKEKLKRKKQKSTWSPLQCSFSWRICFIHHHILSRYQGYCSSEVENIARRECCHLLTIHIFHMKGWLLHPHMRGIATTRGSYWQHLAWPHIERAKTVSVKSALKFQEKPWALSADVLNHPTTHAAAPAFSSQGAIYHPPPPAGALLFWPASAHQTQS